MRAIGLVLFAMACTAADVSLGVAVLGPSDVSYQCSEQCTDRKYAEKLSARELGGLAIWRARRGNCTCGYALANATGMKDLRVREQVIADPALRACIEPRTQEERRVLFSEASRPGTIAACIGDE